MSLSIEFIGNRNYKISKWSFSMIETNTSSTKRAMASVRPYNGLCQYKRISLITDDVITYTIYNNT